MFDIEAYATESVKLYLQCDQKFYKRARFKMKEASDGDHSTLVAMCDVVDKVRKGVEMDRYMFHVGFHAAFRDLARDVGLRWISWDAVANDLHVIWSENL